MHTKSMNHVQAVVHTTLFHYWKTRLNQRVREEYPITSLSIRLGRGKQNKKEVKRRGGGETPGFRHGFVK